MTNQGIDCLVRPGVSNVLPLRYKNADLPQLGDNVFRRMPTCSAYRSSLMPKDICSSRARFRGDGSISIGATCWSLRQRNQIVRSNSLRTGNLTGNFLFLDAPHNHSKRSISSDEQSNCHRICGWPTPMLSSSHAGAQEDRDAVCTHEAHPQTRPASTARLEWRQRRSAAHSNCAESTAARRVPLPCPAIGSSCLPSVETASSVSADALYRNSPNGRAAPAGGPEHSRPSAVAKSNRVLQQIRSNNGQRSLVTLCKYAAFDPAATLAVHRSERKTPALRPGFWVTATSEADLSCYVVLDRDGRVAAVIVDVGSFLGMGGKDVAVHLSDIKSDNNRLTLDMTKEQLQQAQAYQLENSNTGAGTSTSPVHGGQLGTGSSRQ